MRATKRRPVTRLRRPGGDDAAARVDTRADLLAGEEPLEIRIGGRPFTVTMRTPGNDFDLAAGFLVGEGVIGSIDDITEISYGPGVDAEGLASYNIVEVTLADGVAPPDPDSARQVYTSSSCGICGTSSIEAVTKQSRHPVADDPATIALSALLELPATLRAGQELFRRTGGVHAAGLFRLTSTEPASTDSASTDSAGAEPGSAAAEPAAETPSHQPDLLYLAEDVGRHNAVDKVIGAALRDGRLPLRGTGLQVSGRASFELVQKASMAGIPLLSAVSAPSALAVELAAEVGLTLAGFSRGDSVNLYSRADRVRV